MPVDALRKPALSPRTCYTVAWSLRNNIFDVIATNNIRYIFWFPDAEVEKTGSSIDLSEDGVGGAGASPSFLKSLPIGLKMPFLILDRLSKGWEIKQ